MEIVYSELYQTKSIMVISHILPWLDKRAWTTLNLREISLFNLLSVEKVSLMNMSREKEWMEFGEMILSSKLCLRFTIDRSRFMPIEQSPCVLFMRNNILEEEWSQLSLAIMEQNITTLLLKHRITIRAKEYKQLNSKRRKEPQAGLLGNTLGRSKIMPSKWAGWESRFNTKRIAKSRWLIPRNRTHLT
jgi:hypothetical protein